MGLIKCKCGGSPKYTGEYMVDQYTCDKCGYHTGTYFDGDHYAMEEWNLRNKNDPRGLAMERFNDR